MHDEKRIQMHEKYAQTMFFTAERNISRLSYCVSFLHFILTNTKAQQYAKDEEKLYRINWMMHHSIATVYLQH